MKEPAHVRSDLQLECGGIISMHKCDSRPVNGEQAGAVIEVNVERLRISLEIARFVAIATADMGVESRE